MPGPSRRVVVLGGGPAGMATAARLAKSNHRVSLVASEPVLGGDWADDLTPSALSFPAPWRDLFRKSGRPLEEEARRAGLELAPAPPVRHEFADGSVLRLPTNRGEQDEAIRGLLGDASADHWRELVDGLARVWQRLRFLGLETALTDESGLDRRTRAELWSGRTVADLAADAPDPRLAALIAELGYLNGSTPADTPAHCAVTLFVDQAFGRWQLQPIDRPDQGPVPLRELIRLLAARLDLRRVDVRLGQQVIAIEADRHGVRAVTLGPAAEHSTERITVDALVCCADPWRLYRELLGDLGGPRAFRVERRRVLGTEPALAPAVTRVEATAEKPFPTPSREAGSDTGDVHHHQTGGPPVIETWHRTEGVDEPIGVRFDFRNARPDPRAGVRWQGFASWLDRPPTSSALPGLFLAGPWSRGGPGVDREILAAALAADAAHR